LPPKPMNTRKPNNGGWGVPCNQHCRANCYGNFKDGPQYQMNDRIENCMIYSCACDLSLFGFGGNSSAGPNGATASITGPNGETISANANAGAFGGSNSINTGSSSTWGNNNDNWGNQNDNWGNNSGSNVDWNSNSNNVDWNSGTTHWNADGSVDTGSSSSSSSSSSSISTGGSSIHMNTGTGTGQDMSSSISINGNSISANAGGAGASIDISGFPNAGNYTYNETHSGDWNVDQRNGAFGSGIDFKADVTGNVKIDWADVERAAAQWGVQNNQTVSWNQSGNASMPNMSIDTNVNSDGQGVSAGINMGGQTMEVSAGAGTGASGASIQMDGFPGATGEWSQSGSNNFNSNSTWTDNGKVFSGEGVDFSASVTGTVNAGQAAAISQGWSSNSSSSQNWNSNTNINSNINAGATPGSASGSIDMNGQSIKTDVKVNPDGSVSGGIDMGNGQTMDVSAGPNGAQSSMSGPGASSSMSGSNWGGFMLVQVEGQKDIEITPLAIFLAACVVFLTVAGVYFFMLRKSKSIFRHSGRQEQKNAYKEKFNFLESQEACVEQNV